MKLLDWRKAQNITQTEAAEKIGVTPVSFGRYEGGRVPEPQTLQKIIEVTGGAVTANDFFEIPNTQTGDAA